MAAHFADPTSRSRSTEQTVTCAGAGAWSPRKRAIISLIIALQLLAVIGEPFRFFTRNPVRGPSPVAVPVHYALRPYIEFAYLNHGYFFFAPQPGPSHLMQCSLVMPDSRTATLRYPDKSAQWPRLLYHRHFMLSEFLNQLHVPPIDPEAKKQLPEMEYDDWVSSRNRYLMVRQSMESHLQTRYGATSVTIERLRHILPGDDAVLSQNLPLNDPRFYIVLPDTVAASNTEAAPLSPFSPIARPSRFSGERVEAAQ